MPIELYQFAISHYSEKVRWALDLKSIAHEPKYLLPGMHVRTIRGLTGQKVTSVPVLVDSGHVIQGSAAILDHLEEISPDPALLPADSKARGDALAWEKRLDDEAGPAVRTFAYHHLLQRPKLVAPLLAAKTPFWNAYLIRLAFSRVEETMREMMRINEKTAAKAQSVVEDLLDEIGDIYRSGRYLAGDSFSRADLTAGALFAPLFMPEQYPVPWPRTQRLPQAMAQWRQDNRERLEPVADCYRKHR